ncbi:hypothetical protein [uncultured Psychroserpens sp.]|uniref:hypothetical protein n=1 Tax=uncultured Psychroserpens sp. TaxID=255436 RepID=UPI002618BC9F|nr:hypothetical protein [uncultured Psychroserpens sp.]
MINHIDFNVGHHIITYRINWLGIETVLLDRQSISKKLSLRKRVHSFNLNIDGTLQTFHLESKQHLLHGNITVNLFQNGALVATKIITLYNEIKGKSSPTEQTDNSDTMFCIGVLFIVLSLSFDWSKFFLFLGLIFLFDAVSKTHAKTKASGEQHKEDVSPKH